MPPVTNLGDYRRRRQATSSAAPVKVLRETDPKNPNLNHYFIVHEDCDVVNGVIKHLIAEVDTFGNGGRGEFSRPRRMSGLYFSTGEVEVWPDLTEYWK